MRRARLIIANTCDGARRRRSLTVARPGDGPRDRVAAGCVLHPSTDRMPLAQYASVRSTDESDSSSDGEEPPRDTDRSSCADARHPPRTFGAQAAYLACCCGINAGVYFLYHAVPSTATLLRRDFGFSATQIGTLQ